MARQFAFRTWDDYFIPGTTVLRNKLVTPQNPYGEAAADRLREKEEHLARLRLRELDNRPIVGSFDYDHMKAIHGYIFQDVYEWAGQERVGPIGFMTKDGHSYYPAGPALTEAAEAEYRKIADKNLLVGLDPEEFVTELAERWGEINVIHSFREGNTRSQFVFFSQLTANAGYRLDAKQFKIGGALRDAFVEARYHSQDTGSNSKLVEVLKQGIFAPRPDAPHRAAAAEDYDQGPTYGATPGARGPGWS